MHAGTTTPASGAGVESDLAREAGRLWELRLRDTGRVLRRAEELRDDALAAADDLAAGRALTVIGACHLLRNDFPAALRALLEALAALDRGPDEDLARALGEAGQLEATVGRSPEGVERLFAALDLYDRLGDTAGQASTLNRIGVVFYGHRDLVQAEDAYRRSLDLLDQLDNPVQRAGVRNNLAKVHTERRAYDDALQALAEARALFEAAGESRGVAMTLHNTAVALQHLGRRREARELFEAAIDGYDAAGHVHGACESRTHLGRLLDEAGDTVTAEALFRRALRDADERGLDLESIRAAEGLAALLEGQARYREALRWLRHARDVERRVFDAESDQRLRTLQVRFQLERLERDTVTDPLTGLLNRRGLDHRLREAVDRARQDDQPLSLLLCDLDDFKQVNDGFSHSTGDEVLRAMAMLLRRLVRPTDLCARYGGEEFVVILPGCTSLQARDVAGHIVRGVREHDWSSLADGLTVTVSVGVACLDQVADAQGLLAAADRTMYDAKRRGKDTVG